MAEALHQLRITNKYFHYQIVFLNHDMLADRRPLSTLKLPVSVSTASPFWLLSFSGWRNGTVYWSCGPSFTPRGICASLSKKLLTLCCLAHYRWLSREREKPLRVWCIGSVTCCLSSVHSFLTEMQSWCSIMNYILHLTICSFFIFKAGVWWW